MSAERPALSDSIAAAAGLAAAAGVIHIKAAIDHAGHWWLYGLLFAVVAYAQIGWAALVVRGRRDRRILASAVYVSLAVAAVWLLSRTAGLPFGPWAWEVERGGIPDVIATLDEVALAALLTAGLHPGSRAGRAFAWMLGVNAVRLGVMLGSASVLALAFGSHSHH